MNDSDEFGGRQDLSHTANKAISTARKMLYASGVKQTAWVPLSKDGGMDGYDLGWFANPNWDLYVRSSDGFYRRLAECKLEMRVYGMLSVRDLILEMLRLATEDS